MSSRAAPPSRGRTARPSSAAQHAHVPGTAQGTWPGRGLTCSWCATCAAWLEGTCGGCSTGGGPAAPPATASASTLGTTAARRDAKADSAPTSWPGPTGCEAPPRPLEATAPASGAASEVLLGRDTYGPVSRPEPGRDTRCQLGSTACARQRDWQGCHAPRRRRAAPQSERAARCSLPGRGRRAAHGRLQPGPVDLVRVQHLHKWSGPAADTCEAWDQDTRALRLAMRWYGGAGRATTPRHCAQQRSPSPESAFRFLFLFPFLFLFHSSAPRPSRGAKTRVGRSGAPAQQLRVRRARKAR
jgi:hypothetical protein